MVINVGALPSQNDDLILGNIQQVVAAARGGGHDVVHTASEIIKQLAAT